MRKRTVSLFLLIALILSLTACGSTTANGDNAKAKQTNTSGEGKDILFNNILWGTPYEDAIRQIRDLYHVDFSEPNSDQLSYPYGDDSLDELVDNKLNMCRIKGYRDEPFGINTLTHFSVISLSPVTVAGYEAYIILDFVFPNDGKEVKNNDISSSVLDAAEYVFSVKASGNSGSKYWGETFIEKYLVEVSEVSSTKCKEIKEELAIHLQEKYGNSDYASIYKGGNNTLVSIEDYNWFYATLPVYTEIPRENTLLWKTSFRVDALGLIYSSDTTLQEENHEIIKESIENEYFAREQEYVDRVKSKDSSGL